MFEKAVVQKQEEIIILEEDVNFNRMESEKHIKQKRELEKLYQELMDDYKAVKNKYETEV